MTFLLESEEKAYVYWYRAADKGLFLTATPIDVSEILRERLFEQFDTVVLTSATLAVGGQFRFSEAAAGDSGVRARWLLEAEFDFREQALLYIPRGDAGCARRDVSRRRRRRRLSRLLEISKGRAFCLFTSYNQMNDIFERCAGGCRFRCCFKGRRRSPILLERFRTTPNAVLFATASFWQGVDVPGTQLSCVIVDKLPFAVPSDPVVAARVKALQEDGRNPFAEYQVPEAVLALKQGLEG